MSGPSSDPMAEPASDLETVPATVFAHRLRGVGVNLIVRDVPAMVRFMAEVFGLRSHRVSADFALLDHDGALIQLHADRTFARHPLHALLPEGAPRGSGLQFYLFGIDPDGAARRAEAAGGVLLEPPATKPHGLRECTILAPEGHAFSPAIPG